MYLKNTSRDSLGEFAGRVTYLFIQSKVQQVEQFVRQVLGTPLLPGMPQLSEERNLPIGFLVPL